jgi:hypothetical protein
MVEDAGTLRIRVPPGLMEPRGAVADLQIVQRRTAQ